MKKTLPFLLVLSALSVSITAAYYSIFGLSKLFSGEAQAVIIMATSLEFAKILITVILHNYWKVFSVWLKTYFVMTVIILVLITSQGIYGFLTNAYQLTAAKDMKVTKQVELVELKKSTFIERKAEFDKEKIGIIESIEKLRSSLGNNILQTVDKKTGQLITTTSNENRKTYEKQLDEAVKRRDKLSDQISVLNDSITNSEITIIGIQNSSATSSELGPLKYLSNLTGKSMDIIVNWFLILLIIVFDPLAIALVLGASTIFNSAEFSKKQYTPTPTQPTPIIQEPTDSNINTVAAATPLDAFIEEHNIDTEPETFYEPFEDSQPVDSKKKEFRTLHPEQIRNMSHQQIEKFLKENL